MPKRVDLRHFAPSLHKRLLNHCLLTSFAHCSSKTPDVLCVRSLQAKTSFQGYCLSDVSENTSNLFSQLRTGEILLDLGDPLNRLMKTLTKKWFDKKRFSFFIDIGRQYDIISFVTERGVRGWIRVLLLPVTG